MNEIELLLHSPATLVLLIANVVISIAAFNNNKIIDALLFDVGRATSSGIAWSCPASSTLIRSTSS